jgi:2Fe-2S ferredoxin
VQGGIAQARGASGKGYRRHDELNRLARTAGAVFALDQIRAPACPIPLAWQRESEMPKVTYIESDGTQHRISIDVGTTVMRGAIDNNIPGIDGDCDGECACGTCHVYVDSDWLAKTGPRTPNEEVLLDMSVDTQPNSRLACRIKMTDSLDGLTVRLLPRSIELARKTGTSG